MRGQVPCHPKTAIPHLQAAKECHYDPAFRGTERPRNDKATHRVIPLQDQRSDMHLVGAHLRVGPGNGQTHRSAPTVAATLPLEVEFVSFL
jgi:hypothetical protein